MEFDWKKCFVVDHKKFDISLRGWPLCVHLVCMEFLMDFVQG